jgi:hypothetical protein
VVLNESLELCTYMTLPLPPPLSLSYVPVFLLELYLQIRLTHIPRLRSETKFHSRIKQIHNYSYL